MQFSTLKISGLVLALLTPGAASAVGTILFDRDGAGGAGAIRVDTFDWAADNGLAVGLVRSILATGFGGAQTADNGLNTSFDFYTHGRLAEFTSTDFSNGGAASCIPTGSGSACSPLFPSGGEFTFQLGVSMDVVTNVGAGSQTTMSAEISAMPAVNFFNIFYDTSFDADSGAGTGFDNGISILSGVIVDNSGSTSLGFVIDESTGNLRKLDEFGADNRTDFGTYVGDGGSQFSIDVTSRDASFFISDVSQLAVDTNLQSANLTPFSNVNPVVGPDTIVGNAPDYGTNTVTGVAGDAFVGTRTMNDFACADEGLGAADDTYNCDFQMQVDSVTSFFNPDSVPAPQPLLLFGLALGLTGLMRMRKAS